MAISDPRDIPGLLAWYSADAETGYADGQEMTGWTDLSGRGNHATGATTESAKPFWKASAGPNAGPRVLFGNSDGSRSGGYFALPSALLAGSAAGEVMATVRTLADASNSESQWIKTGATSDGTHYPYTTGVVYDDFGSTVRKTIGTPPVSISQWRRVGVWSAAGSFGYTFDGATAYSTSSNTVGWGTMPRLGNSGPPDAASNAGTNTFEGSLACVVIFGRKLTAAERADLDAWLVANPSGGVATGGSKVFLSALLPGVAGVSGALGLHPARLRATLAPRSTLDAALRQSADLVSSLSAGAGLSAALTIEGRVDLAASLGAAAGFGADLRVLHVTDTAVVYANDGYNYGGGVSEVVFDPPIAATPARVRREVTRRVHQSLPAPNLVDGRPV